MPSVALKANCNKTDIEALQNIIDSEQYKESIKNRAKCVLYNYQGKMNKEIAAEIGFTPNIVGNWVRRFNDEGVNGLFDRKRSGRKGGKAPETDILDQIKEKMEEPSPTESGQWDVLSLSQSLGHSVNSVRNALRGSGVTLQRQRKWDFQTSDDFSSESIDIVGIYLTENDKALVVRVIKDNVDTAGSGAFSTRNSRLARDIQSIEENGTSATLEQLLSLAAKHARDDRRYRNTGIAKYLDDLADSLPFDDRVRYFVTLRSTAPVSDSMLHHAGFSFEVIATDDEWYVAVRRMMSFYCSAGDLKNLVQSLYRYASTCNKDSEAFIWRKIFLTEDDKIEESKAVNESFSGTGGHDGKASADTEL